VINSDAEKGEMLVRVQHCHAIPEAEFLDVIVAKVLRVFLLAIQSPLLQDYSPFPPWSKSGLNLVWNVNIINGNLKSENSQDYLPKPQ
jgi:hypothetical protein